MYRLCRIRLAQLRPVASLFSTSKFDLERLVQMCANKKGDSFSPCLSHPPTSPYFEATRGKKKMEMVVLKNSENTVHVGVFRNGAVVGFGLTPAQVASFVESYGECMQRDVSKPRSAVVKDPGCGIFSHRFALISELPSLGFEIPTDVSTSYVDNGELDAIVLQKWDPSETLPLMFCFSFLAQVMHLRYIVESVSAWGRNWRAQVEKTGKVNISIRQARLNLSILMHAASKLSRMNSGQYRVLREGDHHQRVVFSASLEHFEIPLLIEATRSKVSVAQSTLSYLVSQARNKTYYRLEWYIIILIVLECLVALGVCPSSH